MTKVMLFVELTDGSIELARCEIDDLIVTHYDIDKIDRARFKRVLGNWSWYPDWVKLTPEQKAACVEWTGVH